MNGLHLIARIAGRAVAFSASEVDTVVDLGPLTPTPLAATGVVGIAALRSRVVTVIDPRQLLGLASEGALGTRAVVGTVDGHLYAILVEALEDVAEYETVPFPLGVSLGAEWEGVGTSLIDRIGEPVLVVPLARLVPEAAALAA